MPFFVARRSIVLALWIGSALARPGGSQSGSQTLAQPVSTPPAPPIAPAPAPSVAPESAPPVETLIAEALAANPEIRAAEARAAAAEAAARPAGALPGPMIETYLDDESFPRYTVGTSEFSILGIEVRQELPHPARRRAERAVAASATLVPREAAALAVRRVAAGVRSVYARIYALDQADAAWNAGRELLDLMAATATSAYGAGQGGQGEVARAQLERLHAEERRIEIASERRSAEAELARWLGRSGPLTIGPVLSLPQPPQWFEPEAAPPSTADPGPETASAAVPSTAGTADQPEAKRPPASERPAGHEAEPGDRTERPARAFANSPEVRLADAELTAARFRADLAGLAAKPDFSAGVGVGTRGPLDPMVALRFGVQLPSLQKGRAEALRVAAAREVEAARADLRAAELGARAESERLLADVARYGEIAFHLREALLPQARLAFDASRSDYLAGRGDLSGALAAFQTWIDARADLARAEAARYVAAAELAALLGPPTASKLLAEPDAIPPSPSPLPSSPQAPSPLEIPPSRGDVR